MQTDLIDVLIKDHDELRSLFDRLVDPHLLPERSQELASVAIAELVRHSVAEEAYLYPTARHVLDGGEELVTREMADHARAEIFPQLRIACDPDELLRLGARAEAIKRVGPTHPHPSAPDTPPWNIILAPGTGLVDRIRDFLVDRPTELDDLPN